jgi:serine phosphatase RsbU (regulator of sigma subunit)
MLTAADSTSTLPGKSQLELLLHAYAQAFPVAVTVYDAEGSVLASEGDPAGAEITAEIAVAGRPAGSVAVSPLAGGFDAKGTGALASLLADVIADQATRQLEIDSMAAELLDKYEELTLLYDLNSALRSVFDVKALCEIALAKALKVVPSDRAHVVLEEGGNVTVTAARGADELVGAIEPVGAGVSGRVVETGKQVLLHQGEEFADADRVTEAVLSVPVVSSDEDADEVCVLGALTLVGRPAAERFTAGNAKVASAIAGQLGAAIASSRLVDSLREAERIEQEVEIAAQIQRSLLPSQAPELPGLAVAGLCVPAARVGGDYYDLIVDGDGRLSLVIADVAGHSVGSGLLMAMARTVIRREVLERKSPREVLAATNAMLFDDLVHAELFITLACARYEPTTRRLSVANGAHNPLLRRRSDGTVDELDADGMAVGIVDDAGYEQTEVALEPGDVVLLYTDGVTEARNSAGEQLGEARLKDLLAGAGGIAPSEVIGRITQAVRDHAGRDQQDDVTVVVLVAGEST